MSLKHIATLLIAGVMLAACSGSSATQAPASGQASAGSQIIVGLITKTETNPFFVKMKEGAQAKADELGIKLLTGAGAKDGDNEGQVTALENMVNAGAKGILITPSDTKAIVPEHPEGPRQGRRRHRARHRHRAAVGGRRAVRHQQLQRRPPDRPVGQGGHGRQDPGHRHARPAARHHRRRAAPQRLPAGLSAWSAASTRTRPTSLPTRRSSAPRTPTATRPKARPPWRTA